MALDRTWFNALVDDDGSNTVGTVWNKGQIDNLLDSVDAENQAWTPFTPALLADAGLWTATGIYTRYKIIGRAVIFLYAIEGGTLGAATTSVYLSLPRTGASTFPVMTPAIGYLATAWELCLGLIASPYQYLQIQRVSGATLPAGAFAARGQLIYEF